MAMTKHDIGGISRRLPAGPDTEFASNCEDSFWQGFNILGIHSYVEVIFLVYSPTSSWSHCCLEGNH